MINCPKCAKSIESVKIQALPGEMASAKKAKCIAYICPLCSCAISVSIDPLALNSNLITRLKNALSRK
jgi:hypothetical protein